MREIFGRPWFVPGDVKEIIVGPANDRPGVVEQRTNHHSEEAEAFQAIQAAGYKVTPIVRQISSSAIFQIKNLF